MRVITGMAKGHRLLSPEGTKTRPTTDRVKESIFSVIQGYVSESMVLDLFAGSGALGIEALSRGANWCDFVEKDKFTASFIIKNLQKTRFENCSVYTEDYADYLARCKRRYDLVFLDPPYKKGLCDASIRLISQYGILNEGALIICETSAREEISCQYSLRGRYKYGTTAVTVFENKVMQ
ncbi:MAG: Ribosomal RNA small subunit methyltransferase D [Firmicutes bacterium ADurb.Bin193]|nr:MAG: Ribosomal RNA small subunit methyltransferase D [Firmicutes bacterium ADurb.Bin193]